MAAEPGTILMVLWITGVELGNVWVVSFNPPLYRRFSQASVCLYYLVGWSETQAQSQSVGKSGPRSETYVYELYRLKPCVSGFTIYCINASEMALGKSQRFWDKISRTRLVLGHAWLNLWDKHMTTGRINQVTILLAALPSQYSLTCGKESKEKVLASHKCTVRVCHTVHKWFHRQRQYDSTQADHFTVPAQRRFIPFFFPRLQVPSNEHCRNLGLTQPEGSFPGHPQTMVAFWEADQHGR